jgi:hypothetical protein
MKCRDAYDSDDDIIESGGKKIRRLSIETDNSYMKDTSKKRKCTPYKVATE